MPILTEGGIYASAGYWNIYGTTLACSMRAHDLCQLLHPLSDFSDAEAAVTEQ